MPPAEETRFNPQKLAQPHIAALHPYVPGVQPDDEGWIKLNTNESPYPPSPRVHAAIQSECERLRKYPNPSSAPLRETIAEFHGLAPAQVIVGNGSDDILNLLIRVFGGAERPVGMTFPSYSLYPVLTGIAGGKLIEVEFGRDMELPVDAIASSGANIFFLTSPNAPTGVGFATGQIAALAQSFPGILVVDEAYADFAQQNALSLLEEFPNTVITRTLSKSYALAGLRVGYGLAHPDVIGLLDRVRDSYNVNRLSQTGAMAALADALYYRGTIGKIINIRNYFAHTLDALGWFTYPTQANFVFTEPRNARGESGPEVAAHLFEYLKEHKILVRYFSGHALTASFLRISIGDDIEMQTLIETIEQWLKIV